MSSNTTPPSPRPTTQAPAQSSKNGVANASSAEKPVRVAPVKKSSATEAAPAKATAAAKKSAGAPTAKPASVAKKAAPKKTPSTFEAPAEPEWHRLISEAAYHRAERRGFAPGHEHEDWVWAEEEVRKKLSP